MPALTAVQIQQGWAHTNDVNLLAAGVSRPMTASTGSGIFSGAAGALGDAVLADRGNAAGDTVLVRSVPKVPFEQSGRTAAATESARDLNTPVTGVRNVFRENLSVFEWRPVNVSTEMVRHRLCNAAGFCCQFEHQLTETAGNVRDDSTQSYEYIAALYYGPRRFGGLAVDRTVLSCGVIACCDHRDVSTCAVAMLPDRTLRQRQRFSALRVSTVFDWTERMVVFPSTLAPALLPLRTSMYEWRNTAVAVAGPIDGQPG